MNTRPSDDALLGLYVWVDGSAPLPVYDEAGASAPAITSTDYDQSIDIIAVQGLGASPYFTWVKTVPKVAGCPDVTEVMWLRDLLPQHIKGARIASYSYLSHGRGVKTSLRELGEKLLHALHQNRHHEPQRPIVFIGHSMGGLVIKQALVLIGNRPKFRDIKRSTVGIVFLGTPHAGTDLAGYGTFIAMVKKYDAALIESLKPTDTGLYDLSTDFAAEYKNLSVMCFYEKIPNDYSSRLGWLMGQFVRLTVVEQRSAVREGQDMMYLLADHSGLNKFSGEDDPNFKDVCAAILSMVRDAQQVMQQRQLNPGHQSRSKPLFTVPIARDQHFTGREVLMSQIDKCLQVRNCVSLHGIGGIGKSQIVTEYAYRLRERNPSYHVLWISGATYDRFRQTCQAAARELRLPGCEDVECNPCELVSIWLNKNDEERDFPWLMILDNADNKILFFPSANDKSPPLSVLDGEKPISYYLPSRLSSTRRLIVTSRSEHLGSDLTLGEPSIMVPPLSLTEGQTLLQRKARSAVDRGDPLTTDKLLDVLGHIPLAITQAAAFMNRNRISAAGYLAALKKDEVTLTDHLSEELQDPRRERGVPNSVFRTWKVSFDRTRDHEPFTAELLSLMAMLDRQQIPETLLRQPGNREIDFSRAIGTLEGLCLITRIVGNTSFAMHRLVQLSIRYWLSSEKRETIYEDRALRLLAERFPNGKHENKNACESMLQHAQIVLQYSLKPVSSIQQAKLLHNVGWFNWQQGRYNMAFAEAAKAYMIRKITLGEADQETLGSLSLQATIIGSQGNYEQAEEMHRRALKLRETVLGVEHLDTLTSMNNLAEVLSDQGKYEQAEEMNRRVLKLRETVLGVEHLDTLTSMNNLAEVLRHQGKYEQAEEMHRRTLKLSETGLGVEHPLTLTSMNNLASVLSDQGKYEQAEEMHRRTLKLSETGLGVEHPLTLSSMNNLASALSDQGKYEQAEEMHRQALKLSETVLGVEHPLTLTSMNNLAGVLRHQGKYEQAEEMHRQALKLRETVLGVEHPLTLTSMNNLASVYWNQERWHEAEALEIKALKTRLVILGPGHPDVFTSMINLAYTWKSQGRDKEAIALMSEAEELQRKVLGIEHSSTLVSSQTLEEWNREALNKIATSLASAE